MRYNWYFWRRTFDRFRAAFAAFRNDPPMTGDEAEIVTECIMVENPRLTLDEARDWFWQWVIVTWYTSGEAAGCSGRCDPDPDES